MKSIKNLPSQGECKINRNHIKKPLLKKNAIQELKNREGGFILNGDVINSKLNYDPINDEHLKQFFVNKKIKPYLNKLSKIVNRSNHTSDDDQISKDDTTRIISQNNTKNSQMTAPNLKQKSESESKDIRIIKIQEGDDDDYKQQEVLKEKEKNYQQLEFPKISINNSNNFNNNTLNNSTATNLNSTKENSNINHNNTSMNFLNNSINNSNNAYGNNYNNTYNSSLDQSGRISNQDVKKNEFKLQTITKVNNYQSSGLRNKIILRPLQNQDKMDKDSLDIKRVYGSIKQEESINNYKLPQKRNSQNSLNCTAINSDQENYASSDYKVNPIKNLDPKKKIRSITGNKKIGYNDTTLSTIDNTQQQSQNQSIYNGYINSIKKGGILQTSINSKPFICEPNQIYFKNLKSEIENIEKQNESKGIVPVSKDQFSSFLKQFKTKYKSNTDLNQNDEQEDQQIDHSTENKKIEIQQLKKEKQEIIKRQEQELYELEQKIMQFELQEKELHKDICLLDQRKQKLYYNQDDQSYYMNKIVIPSPKKNENFVIHEQVLDEETYRSRSRKQKAHHTDQIEEDIEEMMYTKPVYGDNNSKKWLSEEKNYSKSSENFQQKSQEDYKTEFDYSDEQKSYQGKQKSNHKSSLLNSQNGYETDEFHSNNQQNQEGNSLSQNSQIEFKSNQKKQSQYNYQNEHNNDDQQHEQFDNQQNLEENYQNTSQKKKFSKKHQSPKSVEKYNTPKNFKNSEQQQECSNQNYKIQNEFE
ncbi:hypothetical protein ABPG74_004515 [Tetrahymena malaccensis]